MITIGPKIQCPTCGAPEMHPTKHQLLIRAYKVDNWSQCLVCSGYYDTYLNNTPHNHDGKKGWFLS